MMDNDEIILKQLINCNEACVQATDAFVNGVHDPVPLIRSGLRGTVVETLTALGLLLKIDVQQRVQVFDELVRLSVSQKFGQATRRAILSLPRKWVLDHLEEAIEPLLQGADSL